jgi:hypothetical protein
MRLLIILIGLSIASCSAPKLYNQGVKKINKAIEKDPSLKIPERIITNTDTIIKRDSVTNEIIKEITKTVTVTEYKDTCDNDPRPSRRELRHARKMYNDSLNHERRMFKLEKQALEDSLAAMTKLYKEESKRIVQVTKIENKTSPFLRFIGRMWWLFVIAGFIGGFYIRKLLFK